jgi:pimeloyl-ACP methyl ester carboxylesterase
MSTLRANGIEIYYETQGAGEPLLLIMGLGANTTGWAMQISEFARHHRVIAFDNRGAGRSEKPNEPYTIPLMAEDAVGVMDALGISSAHVFGVSLGGMIAQELVLAHPHRVRTLILGGTMAGGPGATFAGPQLVRDFIALTALPLQLAIENGLKLVYSDGYIEANKDLLVQRAALNAHLTPPLFALQRQFLAVVGFNTAERLYDIKAPTLVLTGTEDKVIPFANARILAERIPAASLVEFEGAGHGFLVERADEVNAAILNFLRPFTTYAGPK